MCNRSFFLHLFYHNQNPPQKTSLFSSLFSLPSLCFFMTFNKKTRAAFKQRAERGGHQPCFFFAFLFVLVCCTRLTRRPRPRGLARLARLNPRGTLDSGGAHSVSAHSVTQSLSPVYPVYPVELKRYSTVRCCTTFKYLRVRLSEHTVILQSNTHPNP